MEGPYKIFIAEGTCDKSNTIPSTSKSRKSTATDAVAIEKVRHAKLDLEMSGTEVRQFYEELLVDESRDETSSSNDGENSKNFPEKSIVKEESLFMNQSRSKPAKDYNSNDLFKAIMSNDLDLVLEIASSNPDLLNVSDQYGWTALMMAACEGFIDICCLLIELGADVTLTDCKGNTAELLAEIKGHNHVVALLQSANVTEISSDDDEDMLEPFDCETCSERITESSKRKHEASTLHQFNLSRQGERPQIAAYGIPVHNKGYQLMLKQGWDNNRGLGPHQSGRQYPIKTVLRKERQGLGMKQTLPRVSHFGPNDPAAIKYRELPKVKTRRDMQRDKRRNQRLERNLRRELS